MGQESKAKLERRLRREFEEKLTPKPLSLFSQILQWPILGAVATVLLGFGAAALSLAGQYLIAKGFFLAAIVILCTKSLTSEFRRYSGFKRVFLSGLVVFISIAVFAGLDRWVEYTSSAKTSSPTSVIQPTPAHPDLRAVFVHDWDSPLRGLFVVIKLTQEVDLNELGDYSFIVQLTNTGNAPKTPSILVGGHNELANGGFGVTKGNQSRLWTYSPLVNVNGTFIWRYSKMNRLEAGASFDGKSPVASLGALNHSFIQFRCSPKLVPLIDKISLFANDYEIYTVQAKNLGWKPMGRDINLYRALPKDFKIYNYIDANLNRYTLDFSNIDVRSVPILYDGRVWTASAETIFPGQKGWLPDAVVDP